MTRLQTAAADTDAYVAPSRPSPGKPVLLLHARWGFNDVIHDFADRLAGDGFTVLAPDLFDGTVLRTAEEATAHQERIEGSEVGEDRLHGRDTAVFDYLLALPEVDGERAAVIALSFGAWYGARLADRRPEVAAVVIYYGGIGGSDLPGHADESIQPAYLGHFAAEDPYVDDAESMMRLAHERAGSKAYLYEGTHHWFAESDRPEYNEEASELAYLRTVEFLRANLT
jgi:carboxymethylenebutenolidase